MDRRPRSLTIPIPVRLSLDLLPPMDGELEAAEWDISVPFHQTPRAGQDRADSLCLLDVLNAFRQAHVECLWEQEGHGAAAHCHAAVRHLGQRPPHLIQQEHEWSQSPPEACHEGGVSHPILPGKGGDHGGGDHHKKNTKKYIYIFLRFSQNKNLHKKQKIASTSLSYIPNHAGTAPNFMSPVPGYFI